MIAIEYDLSSYSFFIGVSEAFAPITDVKFSPNKPSVFAAASADGFLYIYDLASSITIPTVTLEAVVPSNILSSEPMDTTTGRSGKTLKSGNNSSRRRSLSKLAFNHRQRDLIAACDVSGRVHIWRLSWKLSNRGEQDLKALDNIVRYRSET